MHDRLGVAIAPLVVLHVASAFAFALVHGPSVAAMMKLRREKELERVRALLELSRSASVYSWAAWLALAATGALLASAEHLWRAPWVWGSVVVLVGASLVMSPLAARRFNEARIAAGLPWFNGRRVEPGGAVDPQALQVALGRIRKAAPVVMWTGVGALALLVWLMVARPG